MFTRDPFQHTRGPFKHIVLTRGPFLDMCGASYLSQTDVVTGAALDLFLLGLGDTMLSA